LVKCNHFLTAITEFRHFIENFIHKYLCVHFYHVIFQRALTCCTNCSTETSEQHSSEMEDEAAKSHRTLQFLWCAFKTWYKKYYSI